jgi:hypothetical protein
MAYFPTSPTDGQSVTVGNVLYSYNAGKGVWKRSVVPLGNLTVTGNVNASSYYITTGVFWSGNGQAFAGSLDSGIDANIGTLHLGNIATNANLGTLFLGNASTQANIGAFYGYANANIGTLFLGNSSVNSNLGAFQNYANANIGTLFLGNASTNANLGAFQTFSNANAATQATAINTINANLGAYQLYANANIGTLFLGNASTNANLGTLFLGNASTQANLGAFQTFSNANAATQATAINTINANLGAYQLYANANIGTLFLGNASTQANLGTLFLGNAATQANIGTLFLGNASTQANIGTLFLGNASTQANIGTLFLGNASTQANIGTLFLGNASTQANIGTLFLGNASTQANIGTIFLGNASTQANIGTLFLGNADTQANLGAFQSYANANIGTIRTNLNTLDANVGAFELYANTIIGPNNTSNLVVNATTESVSAITGALVVKGGAGIGGNLYVAGNIYASNLTAISVSTLSVQDPLLYLTASNPYPYNYDIGVFSHYSIVPGFERHTGLARDYTTNVWGFFSNLSANPGATVNWAEANLIYDTVKLGDLIVSNTTQSTSTSSGALRVAGGAGIAGELYIANTGDVSANIGLLHNANIAINANLGAYQLYANANVGSIYNNLNTLDANIGILFLGNASTQANLGAFQTYNNSSIATLDANIGTLFLGNASTQANLGAFYAYANTKIGNNSNGNLVIAATAESTSNVTGALVVAGGVGVSGNLFANTLYTTTGIRWAGNGAVFSSGGGGGSTPGGSDTQVQFNDGGSALGGDSTFSFNKTSKILSVQQISVTNSSGDEGGEILLAKATTNTTLVGTGVTVDIYQNRIRFFEQGGSARGYYLDISSGGGGASTNIMSGGGGGTPAGATGAVQFNNGGALGATSLVYDSASGNILLTDTTESVSNVTGAMVIQGGLGVAGNVYANTIYTTTGIRWAGNGVAFSSGGGSSTPGGSDTQIQYNSGGTTFAGSSGFTFNSTNGNVTVTSNIIAGNARISNNVFADTIYTTTGIRWAGNGVAFSSGGGSTPGGSDTQVQFNDGGSALGGSSGFTFNSTNGNVTITSNVVAGNARISSNVFANKLFTTTGLFWAGNGAVFSTGGGGGGGGLTYTSDSNSPGSPALGDQWYDTDTDILYEYIEDGVSSYWVDMQSPIFSSGITSSVVGNVSITGPTSSIGHLTVARTITASGNIITLANISVSRSANILGNLTVGGNVAFSRDASIAANLTVTGNIASGNITTANITATGNITTVGSISGTTLSTANIAVTSNVTAGNISVVDISSSGNITSANITTNQLTVTSNVTSPEISSSGNITAGNLIASGNVSFTGANVYLGNVANLSIAGGTSGQVLQTNGAGELTWETPPATNIQEFTATASQSTFTVIGTYTVGSVLVFVNGIQLNSVDYTATSGTTVVLAEPRNVGDTVRIVANYGAVSLVSGLTLNVNNLQSFSVAMSVALGM